MFSALPDLFWLHVEDCGVCSNDLQRLCELGKGLLSKATEDVWRDIEMKKGQLVQAYLEAR